MNAIQLVESFKKEVKTKLSSKDIAFCHNIINMQGITEKEKEKLTTKYLSELNIKKIPGNAITEKANHMDIYMSLHDCLLFSYNLATDDFLNIPKKYYVKAPQDFDSMLIVLPNSKMIIKVQNFKKQAFYGSRSDKVGNLICIKTYLNQSKNIWRLMQDCTFIDTYYPHFSIACPLHCEAYIKTSVNIVSNENGVKEHICIGDECKMSANRTCICKREQELKQNFGNSFLYDYYALAMMCFDKWENRPIRSNTKKIEKYDDNNISTIIIESPPENTQKNSFKELYLKDYSNYVSKVKAKGWKVRNRLSPCEHIRREHVRHLKNGKQVVVHSTIVNKGKTKAIYKMPNN